MKKQQRRKEKGITLVALVVTIIVLIILAGVTLNIVLDNDGIINKVQQATGEYENAQMEEEGILGQIENYLNPPIPDGYVASNVPGENIVATGLVIYEGNEPVTEENHEEAMLNRNQYVWIPVNDINSMVMCKSNNGSSLCHLVYDKEANTLACQNHPSTATDLVGRLYISTDVNVGNNIYSYIMDFEKRDQVYNEEDYHELNIVEGDASNNITIDQLKSDFTVMAKSVAKNGGFYISRYEVGEAGNSKKGQPVLTAAGSNGTNHLGVNTWYGLHNTIRNISANKQMVWGCQYDQVIKFIGEEAQIGHNDRNLTKTTTISGENELDKMKNIYDLEGNYREWTTEAYSTYGRTYRSSFYNNANTGDFIATSDRFGYDPTNERYSCSSRSTLYL